MGGDDTLVVGEQLFGKLAGDFIGLSLRDVLLIREGMEVVKEAYAVHFLKFL